MSTRTATAVGFISVLLWSQLAVLTTLSGAVPPFQLVAMSFALGGAIGFVYLLRAPNGLQSLVKTPPGAWALGVTGLFGFHFFFFLALRSAPAVEASLINYLWPLLIVLFSAALPARDQDAAQAPAPRSAGTPYPGLVMELLSAPRSCGPAIRWRTDAMQACQARASRGFAW
jgi:EamA domain-containing membrane protein RarD